MWTLAEAQKRSNDVLLKGIIETIIKESPVMAKLPFQSLNGTGITYNRETTLPSAGWYSVNDTWVESSGTVTQHTAGLKILGGDVDIDEFEKATLSDVNDLEGDNVEAKAKAIAHEFEDAFIYGNDATNTKQFDGLHLLVDSGQVVNMGTTATGAALSMASLDQMIDLIKPGRPDALIMNRNIRRRLTEYYRDGAGGASFHIVPGKDGVPMAFYGDIPVLINDFIVQTETIASSTYSAKTGGATTSVFAVKFGPKELHGYEHGGINKKRIGELESKDAIRWRIKWYVGLCLKSIYSLARLDGITNAAATD